MTATAGAVGGRLSRLEQAVSQLQAQAGGGEQLSPNYLTLGPNGQVGANFTGLINALGLILPAGVSTTTPAGVNEVAWERQSDGAAVATVWAGESGVGAAQEDVLQINAGGAVQAAGISPLAALILNANTNTNQYAGLGLYAGAISGHSELLLTLVNAAGVGSNTLIFDDLGRSSFVRIGFGAAISAIVTGTVTWAGATDISNGTVIPLTGASGTVQGMACAASPVNTTKVPVMAVNSAAGAVTIAGQTPGIVQGAGTTCGFVALLFGN